MLFDTKLQEERDAAADEIERLQGMSGLRTFLDERYPQLQGSGWLQRDQERAIILDFICNMEAAAEDAKAQ
jgi:hypothetical protein